MKPVIYTSPPPHTTPTLPLPHTPPTTPHPHTTPKFNKQQTSRSQGKGIFIFKNIKDIA